MSKNPKKKKLNDLSLIEYPELKHFEIRFYDKVNLLECNPFQDVINSKLKDESMYTLEYIKVYCNDTQIKEIYKNIQEILEACDPDEDILDIILDVTINNKKEFEEKLKIFLDKMEEYTKYGDINIKIIRNNADVSVTASKE